jgi:hypothetical protein
MFIPRQVADPRRVIAAPSELEEKIPAGSMEDAKTELGSTN